MSDLAKRLREQIDARHKRALEALRELEAYLECPIDLSDSGNNVVSVSGSTEIPKAAEKRAPRRDTRSFREQVMTVTDRTWLSANEIAAATELSVRQVRGVLNAAGNEDYFVRRKRDSGETEYHAITQTQEQNNHATV